MYADAGETPGTLSVNRDVFLDASHFVRDVLVASNVETVDRLRVVSEDHVNLMDTAYLYAEATVEVETEGGETEFRVVPPRLSVNRDVFVDATLQIRDALVASNVEHGDRIRVVSSNYTNLMDTLYARSDGVDVTEDVVLRKSLSVADTLVCSNLVSPERIDIRTSNLVLNDTITITRASIDMAADVLTVEKELRVLDRVVASNLESDLAVNVRSTSNDVHISTCPWSNTFHLHTDKWMMGNPSADGTSEAAFMYDGTVDPIKKDRLAFTFCNDIRVYGTLACGSITINAFEEREKTLSIANSHLIAYTQYDGGLMIGESQDSATMICTPHETVFMKPVYFLHDAYFSSNLRIDPVFNLNVECKRDLVCLGDVYGVTNAFDGLYGHVQSNNLNVTSDLTIESNRLYWHHKESGALWWASVHPSPGGDPRTGDLIFQSKNFSGFAMTDEYNPMHNFTGQHRCTGRIRGAEDDIAPYVGFIVVATGEYSDLDNRTAVTINEAVPVVALATKPRDPRVFGVVSDREDDGPERRFHFGYIRFSLKKRRPCRKVTINSVGEGGIWVCDEAGPLRNGDYITSSSHAGLGMRQEEPYVTNFTVGKITCDCDFSRDSGVYELVEEKRKARDVKRAFVGCTYKC